MIKVTDSTQTFHGKAIVKVDSIKSYEKFRNDLTLVARDMKKKIKYDKSSIEQSQIPEDILVIGGTTAITRRGKAFGVIVTDNGDNETLLSALKKVFGADRVKSWEEFSKKQK